MNAAPSGPYEMILQLCANSAPEPWYPADFARSMDIPPNRLDEPLDQLRLAGLIELTDWISGKGQGYQLTPDGEAVFHSPRLLARLRAGQLPPPGALPTESTQPAFRGTEYGRGEAVRACLAHQIVPRVTQVLIALNFLVFAIGLSIAAKNGNAMRFLTGGDVATAHATGSLSGKDLLQGQWWRLLGCCFVHYGGLHIGMNMYSLWVVGRLAEQIWGRWRYLTIYVLAGLGGSCAAVLANPEVPSAGASGAIWGILACLPAWLFLNRRYLPPQLVSGWMRQLVSVLIINAIISFLPGISWAAHFGGGAVGFVVAILLNQHRFDRSVVRWVFLLLLPLIPVVCVGAVVRTKASSPHWLKLAQGIEQQKERVQDRNEQREIDRFNRDLLPAINEATRKAATTFNHAEELRKVDPAARPAAEIKNVQEELKSARQKLDETLQKNDQTEPFEFDLPRETMDWAKRYCENAVKLTNKYEECLVAGAKWTNDQDRELDRQVDRTKDAFKKFDAKISRAED